jgi:serine/threonine-protein kinase
MRPAESSVIDTVGRYEVLGRLALGGMAEILLARLLGPSGFERPVVVKRILPHLALEPNFVSMFLDEARLAAQIQQRNVAQVHELGQDADNLYLVMEYLEGENVAGIIRRTIVAGRELDPVISAYVVAEACAGLHAAHELTDAAGRPLELVHRDVSPQNIFVTYQGVVKVLDFGIAKAADRSSHTEAGQLKGKFEYMSPEQCRGRPVDRRSDIFALGIVLYEMVTRKRLFKREHRLATLEAVWREAVIPPSRIAHCPPELERIIMKALEKAPEARYQTAAEMRRELMMVIQQLHAAVLPEEAVSTLMYEIFADRVESKREMLRRVRAGSAELDVPLAEVDATVEIPELEQPTASKVRSRMGALDYELGEPIGTDAYALEKSRRTRRILIMVAVVLGACVSGSGAALLWLARERPPSQRLKTVAQTVPRAQLVEVPAKTAGAPAEATQIVVNVTSTPDAANVFVGTKDYGQTPVVLELPRGDQPVQLRISKKGFRDATEHVTPDVNQRLRVVLDPERVMTSVKKGSGKPQTSGFRRFD